MMIKNREVEFKFNSSIVKYNMLQCCKSVLVALSGGADSVCLYKLMLGISDKYGFKLYAAHVNHCIRGADADNDEAYVRSLCKNDGVELFVLKADVPAEAIRLGIGTEECARNIRYRFFNDICDRHGIDKIAVAHNAGDVAETLIFNIARGSGISGMRSISPCRDRIIRPLIEISKSDIEEYCKENGYKYCIDVTNYDTDYTRNFIRHKIMPMMLDLSPEFNKSVRRLCDSACEDADFISKCALDYVNEKTKDGVIDRNDFARLHISVAKRVIILLHRNVQNDTLVSLESKHLEKAYGFIRTSVSGRSMELPGKVVLRIEFDKAVFFKAESGFEYAFEELTQEVNDFYNYEIAVKTFEKADRLLDFKSHFCAFLDNDMIDGNVYVRTRKAGDVIVAEKITKSVKEFFINKKIPISQRDHYPIICDNKGIVWVPGLSVADRVKITNNTKTVRNITVKERNTK